MLSLQDIDNIVLNGGVVVDVAGEKIGSVEQIFTSGDSGEPVFVTVRTGLFGLSESFAPLSGASLEESVIRVAFAKDTVKNGPRIDSDRGAITETQEQELYSRTCTNTCPRTGTPVRHHLPVRIRLPVRTRRTIDPGARSGHGWWSSS